jgi:hypothetical protein
MSKRKIIFLKTNQKTKASKIPMNTNKDEWAVQEVAEDPKSIAKPITKRKSHSISKKGNNPDKKKEHFFPKKIIRSRPILGS